MAANPPATAGIAPRKGQGECTIATATKPTAAQVWTAIDNGARAEGWRGRPNTTGQGFAALAALLVGRGILAPAPVRFSVTKRTVGRG